MEAELGRVHAGRVLTKHDDDDDDGGGDDVEQAGMMGYAVDADVYSDEDVDVGMRKLRWVKNDPVCFVTFSDGAVGYVARLLNDCVLDGESISEHVNGSELRFLWRRHVLWLSIRGRGGLRL